MVDGNLLVSLLSFNTTLSWNAKPAKTQAHINVPRLWERIPRLQRSVSVRCRAGVIITYAPSKVYTGESQYGLQLCRQSRRKTPGFYKLMKVPIRPLYGLTLAPQVTKIIPISQAPRVRLTRLLKFGVDVSTRGLDSQR